MDHVDWSTVSYKSLYFDINDSNTGFPSIIVKYASYVAMGIISFFLNWFTISGGVILGLYPFVVGGGKIYIAYCHWHELGSQEHGKDMQENCHLSVYHLVQ